MQRFGYQILTANNIKVLVRFFTSSHEQLTGTTNVQSLHFLSTIICLMICEWKCRRPAVRIITSCQWIIVWKIGRLILACCHERLSMGLQHETHKMFYKNAILDLYNCPHLRKKGAVNSTGRFNNHCNIGQHNKERVKNAYDRDFEYYK